MTSTDTPTAGPAEPAGPPPPPPGVNPRNLTDDEIDAALLLLAALLDRAAHRGTIAAEAEGSGVVDVVARRLAGWGGGDTWEEADDERRRYLTARARVVVSDVLSHPSARRMLARGSVS